MASETEEKGPFRSGPNVEQVVVFRGLVSERDINKWLTEMGSTITIIERSVSTAFGEGHGFETVVIIWYRKKE